MKINQSELWFGAATSADVAELFALESSYYPDDGYPPPLFYQAVHQWPDLLQVVKVSSSSQGKLGGYCLGAPGQTPGQLWLMSLLVDQTQRGMGLGKQLLQYWLDCVAQYGYQEIWLSVSPSNAPAQRLYERAGFVVKSTEKNYLGIGEDRLLMCCKI